MDNRGVSPGVEKLLVAGIMLSFVGMTATVLIAGPVPEYKAAAGDELSERVVSRVGNALEKSLPGVGGTVRVQTSLSIPATLADRAYRINLNESELSLNHPSPGIGARTAIGLPAGYSIGPGSVQSGPEVRILISGTAGNRTVGLRSVQG